MANAVSEFGHISINGIPYRIDMQSYRWRDMTDFSPRASVPGGSVVFSELLLYQPLLQTDWKHGFGFHWYEDEAGYLKTVGRIDTRQSGIVMLFTNSTSANSHEANGSELIANSTFESNDSNWTNTTVSAGGGSSCTAGTTNTSPLAGSVSGQVKVIFQNVTPSNTASATKTSDKFDVTANYRYKVDFLVSVTGTLVSTPTITDSSTTVVIKWYTNTGTLISTDTLYSETNKTNVSTGTLTKSLEVTAPANATKGEIVFSTYITGTAGATASYTKNCLIDNVSVQLLNQPTDTKKTGFTYFNGTVWAWGTGGLWYWHVANSKWVCVYNTAAVNFALATKDYLFYCPDGLRIRKVSTLNVHTDAGVGTTADDFLWLIVSNGYIYAGVDDTNQIHRSSDNELDDLEGDDTDPNTIKVGAGGYEVLRACNYVGFMYIARQDGLWQLGTDMIARCVVDYTSESSPYNFASLVEYNGFLTFPIRDRIIQWNGVRRSDITPPKLTDTFPYTTYGSFKNLIRIGDYLYCTARTNETTYTESLLCYDGVGWHKLADLITSGTGTISGMFYDAVNNRLWYHIDDTSQATYYIQFQDLSTFPYADFPTSGTHSVYTSRMDMGYRMVTKSTPSLLIEASNLSTSCYLKVYYSIDEGAFTAWGGIDGTTNVVVDSGTTELSDPLGTGDSTLEYNNLVIRIDFVTSSSTSSPVLEGLIVRFLMRPNTFHGYSFTIIGASGYEYGGSLDSRVAKEIQDSLRDMRDSKAPLDFIDPYGVSRKVYITSVTGRAVEYHVEESGAYPDIEQVIDVNLTEVR